MLPRQGRRRPTQAPQRKDLNQPDKIHTFDKGRLELVNIAGLVVRRLVLEPGWRSDAQESAVAGWSQTPHLQYHAAGRIRIVTASGQEFEAGPGDVVSLTSSHEAFVVGEDPVVIVDFHGALGRPE